MRTDCLLGLFSLLMIRTHCGAESDDTPFRPMPIPLAWFDERNSREVSLTPSQPPGPPTALMKPAHYWEDALRHSVYLTIVRNKIDEMIAHGNADYKIGSYSPKKGMNEGNLWDLLKRAPFDRTHPGELKLTDDMSIIATGKLVENNGEFRFTQNLNQSHNCEGKNCYENGVKALWSVKRIRHRNNDSGIGKFHYELNFSIMSEPPKRERKPYENLTRTFTVEEITPEIIKEIPKENKLILLPSTNGVKRSIWLHKNIFPDQGRAFRRHYEKAPFSSDRLFGSLFSDDDYDAQKRYLLPTQPLYQKIGQKPIYEQYQTKKLTPYPYKPHTTQLKFNRPQMTVSPQMTFAPQMLSQLQHHYLDVDAIGVVSSSLLPQATEQRFVPSLKSKPLKPSASLQQQTVLPYQQTFYDNNIKDNDGRGTPIPDDIITAPAPKNKQPVKISYFTDQIRSPIYSGPPSIFNAGSNQFKPLPPVKLHSSKPTKVFRPLLPSDFRPSPQVIDAQFSEPDPLFDAFRPIVKFKQNDTADSYVDYKETDVAESSKSEEKVMSSTRPLKATKKRTTTTTSTTTSTTLEPSTSKASDTETASSLNALNVETTTYKNLNEVKTLTPENIVTTTSVTPTPKERDPVTTQKHKIIKVKKHKRVTTSTTTTTKAPIEVKSEIPNKKLRRTTTSTTTTTNTPETYEEPSTPNQSKVELETKKYENIEKTTKSSQTSKFAITRPLPTTTTTTTTEAPTITTEEIIDKKSHSSKKINRYRQSTLMIKGTSVKHDKWSANSTETAKPLIKSVVPVPGKYPPRRYTSNFQGYIPTPTSMTKNDEDENDNIYFTSEASKISDSSESNIDLKHEIDSKKEYDLEDEYDTHKYSDSDGDGTNEVYKRDYSQLTNNGYREDSNKVMDTQVEENDYEEQTETLPTPSGFKPTTNFNFNENQDVETSGSPEVLTSTFSTDVPKNNTKCKKKKKVSQPNEQGTTSTTLQGVGHEPTTAEPETTSDIFDEIFGFFNGGETTSNKYDESEDNDDSDENDHLFDDDYKYDDDDSDVSKVRKSKDVEEDLKTAGSENINDETTYDDVDGKSVSIFELMTMN